MYSFNCLQTAPGLVQEHLGRQGYRRNTVFAGDLYGHCAALIAAIERTRDAIVQRPSEKCYALADSLRAHYERALFVCTNPLL